MYKHSNIFVTRALSESFNILYIIHTYIYVYICKKAAIK